MKFWGYTKELQQAERPQPAELPEVTISATPAELRAIAHSLVKVADEIEVHGSDFEHERFATGDENSPKLVVFNPDALSRYCFQSAKASQADSPPPDSLYVMHRRSVMPRKNASEGSHKDHHALRTFHARYGVMHRKGFWLFFGYASLAMSPVVLLSDASTVGGGRNVEFALLLAGIGVTMVTGTHLVTKLWAKTGEYVPDPNRGDGWHDRT